MERFLNLLKLFFLKKNKNVSSDELFLETITTINNSFNDYFKKEDLVYLKSIDTYAAFKYEVVKEIMNSPDFGISPMHIALNHIYFQNDEKRHRHNKKVALKHLPFLSKELQYADNDFTHSLFEKLVNSIPKNKEVNLVDYLINPIVFISALNDLDFLEMFEQFNPNDPNFEFDVALVEIKKIFQGRDYLELLIKEALVDKKIPLKMQHILEEASVEKAFTDSDLPQFFTSLIFADAETVASFMSSFFSFIFKDYSYLLDMKQPEKLYRLANEVLRMHVPTSVAFRSVKRSVTFHGVDLKINDLIILYLSAANRDPTVFENPTEIKLDRIEKHLSFGRGRLACIGQFASFRLAMNVLNSLALYKDRITLTDQKTEFNKELLRKIIHLNVKLND